MCERACDEQMVREMDAGERCSYARSLVACAGGAPAFAAGFSSPAKHLKKRLRHLLDHKKSPRFITIFSSALLLAAVVAVTLAGCGLAAGAIDADSSGSSAPESSAPEPAASGAEASSAAPSADSGSSGAPEPLPNDILYSVSTAELERQCGKFTWPVPDYISVPQGNTGTHAGADIAALAGSSVIAARDGTVTSVAVTPGTGTTVSIAHENEVSTSYGNLAEVSVAEGDTVFGGQQIGVVAASPATGGACTQDDGPMCHFTISAPVEMAVAKQDGNEPPVTELFILSDPMNFSYYPPYPYGNYRDNYQRRPGSEAGHDAPYYQGLAVDYASPMAEPTLSARGLSGGHRGLDFNAPVGTPVHAVADGVVEQATYHYSWGNMVLISHADGNQTLYAHLESYSVEEGQCVAQGEEIGAIGMTGNTTGPHLHLEMWSKDGALLDPMDYMPEDAIKS